MSSFWPVSYSNKESLRGASTSLVDSRSRCHTLAVKLECWTVVTTVLLLLLVLTSAGLELIS